MSLLGKIQALFADKERTQAIFPLTKVKAISDDDGTGLDAILDRAVYTDDGVIETSVASRDADTLGGLPAATYATTSFVKNEILNSQVGGDAGEIDLSGLATKDELNSRVDKTGDTMTGDLTINSGDWPSIFLKATGATNAGYLEGSKNSTGSLGLWSQNAANNNATRRGLRLVNSEGNSSIANALILSDLAEGVARKDYKIYGEHNKPTPADIGAAASSHNHAASNITSGTLAVARGGTGLATHTANAVLTGNGTSAVKNVATASGALYATAANGAAKFGTLPIAQGGTGATSRLAAAKNLTNEAVSSPGFVVSLTNSWGKFGYTTLAQLKTSLGMKVLWKNASPGSAFAAQTITVSGLNQCSCIAIIFKQAGKQHMVCIQHKDVSDSLATIANGTRWESGAMYVVEREVTTNFSNQKINFKSHAQNGGVGSDRAIPLAVIGLW